MIYRYTDAVFGYVCMECKRHFSRLHQFNRNYIPQSYDRFNIERIQVLTVVIISFNIFFRCGLGSK